MMKNMLAALVVISASTVANADTFDLTRSEAIYACNSGANAKGIVQAAASKNFADAVVRVAGYETNACPMVGPFTDDLLHGTVVYSEKGGLKGGYRQIAIVKWQLRGSSRERYSVLIESSYGTWQDMIALMLQMRVAGGIIDFLAN